jgi:hypothetical protein
VGEFLEPGRTLQATEKGEYDPMKSKALPLIAATALIFIAASSSAFAETAPSGAEVCAATTEGASDAAAKACEQGFSDASSHATLAKTCAVGEGAVEISEYGHDCLLGFIFAEGVTETEPTASSKAVSECAAITEGAADGSPAACEQGYQDALAGHTQEASCDHIGAGAIAVPEYVISCEDGWFVAKEQEACIPGTDINNASPGVTLAIDVEEDKECVAKE